MNPTQGRDGQIPFMQAFQNGLVPVGETIGCLIAKERESKIDRNELEEFTRLFPPGYWYIQYRDTEHRYFEISPSQFEPLANIPSDIRENNPRILPYIMQSPQRDDEPYLDMWYCISFYDALPLSVALIGLINEMLDDDEARLCLYSRLYSGIKKEVIKGQICIPYGRETFLASSCRIMSMEGKEPMVWMYSFDIKRHCLVAIDRKDYYRFLIEKSGINVTLLPGSIILGYERDRNSNLTAQLKNATGTQIKTEPTTTIDNLESEAKQLCGYSISRSQIRKVLKAAQIKGERKTNNPTSPFHFHRTASRDALIEYGKTVTDR